MSKSYYVETILKDDGKNETIMTDRNFLAGVKFPMPLNNSYFKPPAICLSGHPICRNMGLPSYCEAGYLLYDPRGIRYNNWINSPNIGKIEKTETEAEICTIQSRVISGQGHRVEIPDNFSTWESQPSPSNHRKNNQEPGKTIIFLF